MSKQKSNYQYEKLTLFQLVIFAFFITSCNSRDCSELPTEFSNYKQAIHLVESSKFKIEESVKTSRSSWIKRVSYYSCDGNYGYFICEVSSRKYIHEDVPIYIWDNLKEADSYGRYYNSNIRNNFMLKLK